MLIQSQTSNAAERVVAETADLALLRQPIESIADIQAIERVPLSERLGIDDFCKRVELAMDARRPEETGLYFVADGDVNASPEEFSFGLLKHNIRRTASLLRSRGVDRTDVVAVLMPAVPAIYWSFLGAMSAGIVFPVNWMMEPKQILRLLKESKAKAVIALGPTPGFKIWESLMSIAPELSKEVSIFSVAGPGGAVLAHSDLDRLITSQPDTWHSEGISGDDIAAYVHSGGTTGAPKIVKLSHRGMSYRHWTLQLGLKITVGEVFLHDTPMFHVGGMIGRILSAFASGASMLIPSVMGARDRNYISGYWKFVEKYGVTRLSAVPTTLATLAKAPPKHENLTSLKPYFATGSTALPISVRDEFERISGVRVLNTYGMTENTSTVSIDPREGPSKEGSSGLRMPYTQIRATINDRTGKRKRVCGPNEIGMLEIKGPGVTPGYVNPAHEQGARTDDGWIISGDLGRVDEDGCIFVTGRAKDVIIRGGHNIDPALIEEPLVQSPEVLLAAAVGKPDAYAGELPVAYVQLVEGSHATSADLTTFLQGRIGERAAIPKDIFIVDKLPLTDVGKPLKNVLRLDAAERVFRSLLSDTFGPKFDGRLSVEVSPHATAGTLATIMVDCLPEEQSSLEARIKEIMAPYTIAHAIVWQNALGKL